MDLEGKESRDVRTLLLRFVETARESELDTATQVKLVVRRLSAVDAKVARKIDTALLERLLLAWNPRRGRPKASAQKQDDPFAIATTLLNRATGVKVEPSSRHLLKAECTREALHVSDNDPLRARMKFHNLKDTTGVHMVVRGDDPAHIQWRLAHADLKTTEIYLRERGTRPARTSASRWRPSRGTFFEDGIAAFEKLKTQSNQVIAVEAPGIEGEACASQNVATSLPSDRHSRRKNSRRMALRRSSLWPPSRRRNWTERDARNRTGRSRPRPLVSTPSRRHSNASSMRRRPSVGGTTSRSLRALSSSMSAVATRSRRTSSTSRPSGGVAERDPPDTWTP